MTMQHPPPEIWEHIDNQNYDTGRYDENYTFNSTVIYKLWEAGTSPDDLDVTDQGESVEQMCGQQPGSPPVSTKNLVIQRFIDGGTFGRVHQAVLRSDSGDAINVIIKRPKDQGSDTLEIERKWYNLLPKDQDPTPRVFPQLLFAAMKAGSMMLGMEYMTDTNLYSLIESEDQVAENNEVVRFGWKNSYNLRENHLMPVLEQLIDANRYMKNHHIHHLDIKPANIIYCDDEHSSNYRRLWLIDFGSAIQTESISDTKPYAESLKGLTRAYAPPETMIKQDFLVQGKPIYYVHHTSDIYSIAATCYHLLSGQVPWSNYPTLYSQYVNFKEACTQRGLTELQIFIRDNTLVTKSLSLLLIGMLEVDFTKRTTQQEIVEVLEAYKMDLNPLPNEQGDTNLTGDSELQLETPDSGFLSPSLDEHSG